MAKNSKNNKFNQILCVEREKPKKGLEKSANFAKIAKVTRVFMLHVPLHITKVIDVGGVSLWVSSFCWDTK